MLKPEWTNYVMFLIIKTKTVENKIAEKNNLDKNSAIDSTGQL